MHGNNDTIGGVIYSSTYQYGFIALLDFLKVGDVEEPKAKVVNRVAGMRIAFIPCCIGGKCLLLVRKRTLVGYRLVAGMVGR